MYSKTIAICLSSIVLSGCSLYQSCVAIDDPNELVLSGYINDKKKIPGPVILHPPKSVKVTSGISSGAESSNDVTTLATFFVLVAAAGSAGLSPADIQTPVSVALADSLDGRYHSGKTMPPNPNVTVGEPCSSEGTLLENGATQYTVSTNHSVYLINSAYPAFEIGECVNVFISRHGEVANARIASGSGCKSVVPHKSL